MLTDTMSEMILEDYRVEQKRLAALEAEFSVIQQRVLRQRTLCDRLRLAASKQGVSV